MCGGDLDDALESDGTIKNQTIYDCIQNNMNECNIRGWAGDSQTYVDMVVKCALVDESTTPPSLYCPSGGATDAGGAVPPEEICPATPTSNVCTNPWCDSTISGSCFDDPDRCLCGEQPECTSANYATDPKVCTVEQAEAL